MIYMAGMGALSEMAYVSQPFRVAVLPRLAQLSTFTTQRHAIKVSSTLDARANHVTVGISGSNVGQYVINPVPRLVFDLAIPSTSVVTALDDFKNSTLEHSAEREFLCYGLKSNEKHFSLHWVACGNENDRVSVKVDAEPVDIKIYRRDLVQVIYADGEIEFYGPELKLIKHSKLAYDKVAFTEHFVENGHNYTIVLFDLEDDKVCLLVLELIEDDANYKELSSTVMESFDLKRSLICYEFGKLYKLVDNAIQVFQLPHFQLVQTINLPFVPVDTKTECYLSLKPVTNNRVILTVNNKIYLLDLFHSAILSERTLIHVKTFQIIKASVIDASLVGESFENKTIALGVSTKHGDNPVAALEIINIDIGTNNLKDSIGKGFKKTTEGTANKIQPLFEDESNIEKIPKFDYLSIYANLSKRIEDSKAFDEYFFESLKLQNAFYTEQDRFVYNSDFFVKVIELTLNNIQIDREYTRTLTYLLTHPLFPIKMTKGLLEKLRNYPQLFKQAVVTCPNLPLSELLEELFAITNNELSLDISLRALQDYTKDAIKRELKTMSKIDIQTFIEFVLNFEEINKENNKSIVQLFQFLCLVLDSVGLFSLNGALLERLSTFVEEKISIAQRNAELWFLLDSKTSDRELNSNTLEDDKIDSHNSNSLHIVEYLDI